MFFVPVAAAVVGALVMGSTKPRTSYRKTQSMGSRSGIAYAVEEFPQAGFLMVRAPDGSEAVLQRKATGGFTWSRGRGNPATLKLVRADFGVAEPLPSSGDAP